MITSEAAANAQMHLASVANDARLHAAARLATAHDAVALLAHVRREVLAGQRMRRMETRSMLARRVLGWQLMQQLEHELLAEAQLPGMLRRGRIGLQSGGRQVARQQGMHREHSQGCVSVQWSERSSPLYSLCAAEGERMTRMRPNNALQSPQRSTTAKSRSQIENGWRASAPAHPSAALHATAG